MNMSKSDFTAHPSLDALRVFARPHPHHAMGELTPVESMHFRAICAQLLAFRLRDWRALRETGGPAYEGVKHATPVTEQTLLAFARPEVDMPAGQLSGVETAMACVIFTDVCAELLAYRLLAEAEGKS